MASQRKREHVKLLEKRRKYNENGVYFPNISRTGSYSSKCTFSRLSLAETLHKKKTLFSFYFHPFTKHGTNFKSQIWPACSRLLYDQESNNKELNGALHPPRRYSGERDQCRMRWRMRKTTVWSKRLLISRLTTQPLHTQSPKPWLPLGVLHRPRTVESVKKKNKEEFVFPPRYSFRKKKSPAQNTKRCLKPATQINMPAFSSLCMKTTVRRFPKNMKRFWLAVEHAIIHIPIRSQNRDANICKGFLTNVH